MGDVAVILEMNVYDLNSLYSMTAWALTVKLLSGECQI